jgi:acyl-CoA reductase-like NAD-dependent aldehyde dehydrogenase
VAESEEVVRRVSGGGHLPLGGYKQSGIGRENGTAGFEQYFEIKVVAWLSF